MKESSQQGRQRLDALDRRIAAALQVDGRASWRRVADVLGVSERTVVRRGTHLLSSGLVEIYGLSEPHASGRGDQFIMRFQCDPGKIWAAATSVASRREAVVTHLVTGDGTDGVADLWCPDHRLLDLLLHEISLTPGFLRSSTSLILRYIATLHDWNPGILSTSEVTELRTPGQDAVWPSPESYTFNREEQVILEALAEDGRMPYTELARRAALSEQTARRHVERLRKQGLVTIRAIIDPADLGLPVAALLWIKSAPRHIESLVSALMESSYVRYGVLLLGEYQLMLDVRMPNKSALHTFITTHPSFAEVDVLEASLIMRTLKTGDVHTRDLRPRD